MNRPGILHSGATVERFNLAGACISVCDALDVVFQSSTVPIRGAVTHAYFCSFHSGVTDDDDLHAGDFVFVCAGIYSGTVVSRQCQCSTLPVLSWVSDNDEHAVQVVPRVFVRVPCGGGAALPPVGAPGTVGAGPPVPCPAPAALEGAALPPAADAGVGDTIPHGTLSGGAPCASPPPGGAASVAGAGLLSDGAAPAGGDGGVYSGAAAASGGAPALTVPPAAAAGDTATGGGTSPPDVGAAVCTRAGPLAAPGAQEGGPDPIGGGRPRQASSGIRDGVPFIVLSLCFSSDDFESRRGTSSRLGGVYMSYVLWQYQDRCSSSARRTLAATPPGVDSDHSLRAITPDLVKGASVGWACHAPDGSKLLVCGDVITFLGDYLQVTKTSMLMGYGAKSPFPLCAYRVPGVSGSRFGHVGSSADVGMARTTARTRSICSAVSGAFPPSA